jgi:hypothetical protein
MGTDLHPEVVMVADRATRRLRQRCRPQYGGDMGRLAVKPGSSFTTARKPPKHL